VRKGTTYVGLDVHKQTISVAVAEEEGEVWELGVIANTPEAGGSVKGCVNAQAATSFSVTSIPSSYRAPA
jgi:hypothetical protein